MDEYGQGPYKQIFHDILPAGNFNRQTFYACSSHSSHYGFTDHFIISDPSIAPESIQTIEYYASSGRMSEEEKVARIAHSQNQQAVRVQMQQYQAQYMAAQQYWALQQQLMEQRMAAMKTYYHSQAGSVNYNSNAATAGSSAASYAGYVNSNVATAGSFAGSRQASSTSRRTTLKKSAPKSVSHTTGRSEYDGSSRPAASNGSVYSEVPSTVDGWYAPPQYPTCLLPYYTG
jgi:hypothetical protein